MATTLEEIGHVHFDPNVTFDDEGRKIVVPGGIAAMHLLEEAVEMDEDKLAPHVRPPVPGEYVG